jgi:hypothetical protein
MTTMRLTIEIHDGWLGRPEDLRKILATIAGLECPPTGAGPRPAREDLGEPADPEDRPRGRNGNGRYPGDDDLGVISHWSLVISNGTVVFTND